MARPNAKNDGNGANLGFEADLWKAADALRSNMDAAEYKHVVLGLIFLKYISDAFEEQHAKLDADRKSGADPEDPDEYRAVNIFWVPKEARWSNLKANATQPTIGKTVDDAMLAIERENVSLKGVLPKDYAHVRLDKQRLTQLINLISNIGLGDKANRSKDILGRYMNTSSRSSPAPKERRGASSIRPAALCRFWSRCSPRIRDGYLTPVAGPAQSGTVSRGLHASTHERGGGIFKVAKRDLKDWPWSTP
jgi:type I restriction enzyme M protein